MAKLILSFNGEVVSEHELDKETVTIGRKSGNDIHVDNLAVSGTHAKILTILNDSFIEDLGSTNGTYIDGEKISKRALNDGDVIVLGKHELRYENEAATGDEGDFEKTMILQPGSTEEKDVTVDKATTDEIGKIASELAAAGAAGSDGPGSARLTLLSGANSGKSLEITKVLTTLGKPGVQVAAITRRPLGYFLIVVDTGPENKRPLVNDTEVGTQAHPLSDSDVIDVAGVKMGFYMG